jgi:hypothetical protein
MADSYKMNYDLARAAGYALQHIETALFEASSYISDALPGLESDFQGFAGKRFAEAMELLRDKINLVTGITSDQSGVIWQAISDAEAAEAEAASQF